MWGAGMVCKIDLGIGLEFAPPFVEPLRGALKLVADIAHAVTQGAPPHSFAT
jgi:hypothetical protein